MLGSRGEEVNDSNPYTHGAPAGRGAVADKRAGRASVSAIPGHRSIIEEPADALAAMN